MNIQQIKGSENLDVILNTQRSPLMKIGLGYKGESNDNKAEEKKAINFVKVIKGDNDNPHYSERKKLTRISTPEE